MSSIAHVLVAFATVLLSGCGFVPEKVALSDPRIAPMLEAIAAVDRKSFGFTPIPSDAEVRLESRPRAGYDAMLHIYAGTSRTIAFRQTPTGYKWIHEQEIHTGPKTYKTPDGTFHEQIVITFEIERISGRTPGRLDVQYHGEDSRLVNRYDLTLEEVGPILAEWRQTH
jgi:hypothetical protein